MTSSKKTLVLGASDKPERYSYKAIKKLRAHGHPVMAIGSRVGKVGDIPFTRERPVTEDINTVTLYLNAKNQQTYYNYIFSLHPKRIIFNPGAENLELKKRAEAQNIETLEACTLVLLSTGQY